MHEGRPARLPSQSHFMPRHPQPQAARVENLRPQLVDHFQRSKAERAGTGVGFAIVNFNTSEQTLQSIASLSANAQSPDWILVLDNESVGSEFSKLRKGLDAVWGASELMLFSSKVNLGFAGGVNFLVGELLKIASCEFIGLLNSDAFAEPCLISELKCCLADEGVGIAGGRIHKLDDPNKPDSLGITLFANLMMADRLDLSEPYLGPTGACCMVTRTFALDVISQTGYFFDARYFCYSEDADLAMRALLLGYRPAYSNRLVALHEGHASSRRAGSDFRVFLSWRNSLWLHMKLLPASFFRRCLVPFVLSQALTIGRCVLSGKVRLACRVYAAVVRELPTLIEERRRLMKAWRANCKTLESVVSRNFFRRRNSACN